MTNQSAISLKEFVESLMAGGSSIPSPADCVAYGYSSDWLEEQDVLEKDQPLQRKHAARIVHEFLRRERKEPEEVDGSPAYVLQDLFDCRVCAGHIIQVYVKGIMDGRTTAEGRPVFGTEELLSPEEAENIIVRVFEKKQRRLKTAESKSFPVKAEQISVKQALQLYQCSKNVQVIDVRPLRAFEQGHVTGAVSVPLLDILKNPYVAGGQRDGLILLYCDAGYQSAAAANCLLEAGYRQVFYFAWKQTEETEYL